MNVADIFVCIFYFLSVLLLGMMAGRPRSGFEEFHVAGRRLGWFPVAVLVMMTAFSAFNFVAFTCEVAEFGSYVLLSLPVLILVAVPVMWRIMPFYHESQAISAYAFLEARYSRGVRQMTSVLFMVWRLVWMAVILHATARILAPLTDMPYAGILIAGAGITVIYTAWGGMRAIVWTDMAQAAFLFLTLAACVFYGIRNSGGIMTLMAKAADQGLFRPFAPFDPAIFSFDPSTRISLWSALIGTFVAFLARYGADQMMIQRYMTARSLSDARRGFILNLGAYVLALLSLAVIGCVLAVQPAIAGPVRPMSWQLSRFLLALPGPLTGVAVAGLLASTMSSLDAGFHSLSTAIALDFRSTTTPVPAAIQGSRVQVVLAGILVVLLAARVGTLGTVFEIANRIVNGLGSPILAIVLLGMLRVSFRPRAIIWGGMAGTLWSLYVSLAPRDLALHYYAVVNLVLTLACCLIAEWICRLAKVLWPTDGATR